MITIGIVPRRRFMHRINQMPRFRYRTNRYGRVIGIGGDDRDYIFDQRRKVKDPIDEIFNKPTPEPKKSNWFVMFFKRMFNTLFGK